MNKMNRIINYLEENKVQYLATLGLDGKAKVRPVQFMLEKNGKLWFCTGAKKEMYKELIKNNEVELSVANGEKSWLRMSAKVEFEDNREVKNRILEKSKLVKSIYKTVENLDFITFYLEIKKVEIFEFSENGAIKIEF